MNQLSPSVGANKRRKRVGRGTSSGHGKTSCRGGKGQTARNGGNIPARFEGGQWPLYRRIPKRGFNNIFRVEHYPLNLGSLALAIESAIITATVIDLTIMKNAGIIEKTTTSVKILGRLAKNEAAKMSFLKGKTFKVNAISASGKDLIEKAGGQIELIKIEVAVKG